MAIKHLQTYKNVKSTPAIKYWYAKILYDAGKKRDAKTVLLDIVRKHKNSYYAYAASEFLDGKRAPFSTRSKITLLPTNFGFSKSDINSLFNNNETLITIANFGDINLLDKLRIEDEFIKSFIIRNNGNIPYSVYLAKKAIEETESEFDFDDVRFKLAYPIEYAKSINKYCEDYGQNPYLIIALLKEESTFNEKALSSVGAAGLMQLMPQTASELGFGDISTQMLYEPDLNIKLGTKYFSRLVNMFENNEMLAVLSYNGGPNAVLKWKQNLLNYDFDDFIEDIPYSETQNYVKKVFASYWNYINIYAH